MPDPSRRTPTSLRCRRGPGGWSGCPASGGLGTWRNHSDIVTLNACHSGLCRTLPVSSPLVAEGGADQPPDGPTRVPVYSCRWVKLLDPGGTVKGPTTHLADVWFRSSSITTNELSEAMATRSMRPPRLVSTDESPATRVPPSPAVPETSDPMAEGPHFHARRREWRGGQRPGDVVLYMVYQPLTGGPYRRRIRRCQSRWLFFVRQRAHVL